MKNVWRRLTGNEIQGYYFHYGSILEPEFRFVATLTIKNIPERLRKSLKESAAEHRRSINGEAISCLEKALASGRVDPQEFLAETRALRQRLPRIFLTDRDLRAARREGRP